MAHGQMNIHDDDNAGMPSSSRADVNPEPVEELVFVTLIKHFKGCWSYDEEMEMAVYEWLPMQEPDFYHKVIVKFVTRWGIYTVWSSITTGQQIFTDVMFLR